MKFGRETLLCVMAVLSMEVMGFSVNPLSQKLSLSKPVANSGIMNMVASSEIVTEDSAPVEANGKSRKKTKAVSRKTSWSCCIGTFAIGTKIVSQYFQNLTK